MFALTIGSCIVDHVLKVIAHGPENLDRAYHEIPEISPVAVISMRIPVFVNLSAGMLSNGAVLSILYTCCPVLTLPALSMTQA